MLITIQVPAFIQMKQAIASDVCVGHGDSHGLDIIDVVMALAGCSYKQAVDYFSRIYNIIRKSLA